MNNSANRQAATLTPGNGVAVVPTSTAAPVPTNARPSSQTAKVSAEGGAQDATSALVQLSTLAVKGRAPMTGYSRDQFGPAWEDVDHNGCDTRNDILQRDLSSIVFQAGSHCIVETGSLADPYTRKTIAFQRGEGTSTAVQIDHVVALGDAWQKGAFQWSSDRRLQFANDPVELLAVDGPTNEAKGDGDAATWLPPNKAFRCTYIEIQVNVKAKYGLWVTQAEHDAMANILNNCGATQNEAAASVPGTATVAVAAQPTSVAPVVQPTTAPPASSGSCTATASVSDASPTKSS